MKRLIIFDLNGTLAKYKSSLEKASLLRDLLTIIKIGNISGGGCSQLKKQILSNFPHNEVLKDLSLLSTCGKQFYQFDGTWEKIYPEDFTDIDEMKIIGSPTKAMDKTGFNEKKVWGEVIEDRGSQITYTALGQPTPLDKKKWDADFTKRKKIKAILDKLIPEFSVRLGGTTSVDGTKPGIDNAYGIRKLKNNLGVEIQDEIFVGDALFLGGNNYPAKEAGVVSIKIKGPEGSKRVIDNCSLFRQCLRNKC